MSTDAHHNLQTRKTLFASLLALICIALVYAAFQRDKPWVVPEEVKKLKNPIAPSESTVLNAWPLQSPNATANTAKAMAPRP